MVLYPNFGFQHPLNHQTILSHRILGGKAEEIAPSCQQLHHLPRWELFVWIYIYDVMLVNNANDEPLIPSGPSYYQCFYTVHIQFTYFTVCTTTTHSIFSYFLTISFLFYYLVIPMLKLTNDFPPLLCWVSLVKVKWCEWGNLFTTLHELRSRDAEPEPPDPAHFVPRRSGFRSEPEPGYFFFDGAGAGAVPNLHSSVSLLRRIKYFVRCPERYSCRYRQWFRGYSEKRRGGGAGSTKRSRASVYHVSFRGEPHSDLNWNYMKNCKGSEYEFSSKIENES